MAYRSVQKLMRRTVALRALCSVLSVMLFGQSAAALAQAPAGWQTTDERKGEVTYISPDGRERISRLAYDDSPEFDIDAVLGKIRGAFVSSGCGPASSEARETVFGGAARQMTIRNGVALCTIVIGRTAEGIDLILCNCAEDGQGLTAFTRLALQTFSGSAPAPGMDVKAIDRGVATAQSTGPIGKSVPSSVPSGVWVALVNRTVYDPVMTVRLELGPAYLILSPGGYFTTEMPSDTTLDDAGLKAWARKNPDDAGTYRLEGNRLVMTFASGKQQIATIAGSGENQSIKLDGHNYNSKRYFADGTRLEGVYSRSRITRASADVFVIGNRDLAFSPDGRFARGGKVNTTGSALSIQGGRENRGGRYRIAGSALVLEYSDGEIEILPMWQETPGGPIWFDGEMYTPAG